MNKNVIPQPEISSDHSRNQQCVMENYENSVFVSYAWGGESERTVDELEQAFSKRGIHIVRDKKDIEYKGSIEEFEQRIAKGECVILVISDEYLKSEHCMYELVEVAKNQNLRKRIFPIVLDDARIYRPVDRLAYIKYWEEKGKQLNQAIKDVEMLSNLAGISSGLDKYVYIRANFDYLTEALSDMNTLTPELHAASGFSTLIGAVERAMAGKQAISQSGKTTAPFDEMTKKKFEQLPIPLTERNHGESPSDDTKGDRVEKKVDDSTMDFMDYRKGFAKHLRAESELVAKSLHVEDYIRPLA
jgi:hypothetical protein